MSIKKIGLLLLTSILIISLTACDFHIKSQREVEKYLEERYGQEFTVLSSASVTDDYDSDVWRAKVYTVSPKDDPDTCFYVFNIVEGESFGVPGFRNLMKDTYTSDTIGAIFEELAEGTNLEYELNYTSPVKSSTEYHSGLRITIDPVSPENLTEVCELLSQTFTDTLVKIPGAETLMITTITIIIHYREQDWPEEDFCSIWISPFSEYHQDQGWVPIDTDADAIREYILSEVSR